MMTMAEKTLLGLAIILSIAFAGMIILPAYSYEVSLVTSPDKNNFYVPAGKPFNITCRGSGDDAEKFSSLQWLNKEGNIIPKGIPGTKESQKNSLTLVFTNPKEEESGVYKCMALYEKKQTLQKSVSIIFHGGKPFFDSTYQNLTVTENSFLEILCAAEGESPIAYEWYNQNENKITENSNSSIYVSQVANASVLTIPAVTLSDRGMYTCLASNRHGLSSKIFQLEVLSGDGNDTTNGTGSFRGVLVNNVTARSVKFYFNLSGPVESIKVLYTESREATEKYHTFNYGDNYEIKDLIPAGSYTFKFKTYPPSGNDEWSRPYRVVLLPEKPEVIFRTIDSGTVKLEWLFKFEDRMRKTIDRHEISYFTVQRVSGISWKPSTCAITIEIPECSSSTHTITGLSQNVYYEIQVRAHTESGYSEPYKQKFMMSNRS